MLPGGRQPAAAGGGAVVEPVAVRSATLADVPYVDALRRRESECIGFLSRGVYESAIRGYDRWANRNGRVWIAEVNGDPVGFVYATPGREGRVARIIQVCVQEDARRIEYGRAMVNEVEGWATAMQRPGVGCHVATDIEAGRFWDALGYELRGHIQGGVRRKRVLEDRYHLLPSGLLVLAGAR